MGGEVQHLVFSSRDTTNSRSTTNSSRSYGLPAMGGSMAELIESAKWLPSMGPERQQLTRRLREHFVDVSEEGLRKVLPRDDAGRVTSIGGVLHESGSCRPCRNMLAGKGCDKGMRCCFCHYPHDPVPPSVAEMDPGDQSRTLTRPCKAQREKYRKLGTKMEEQIRADPWSFDPNTVDLPSSIFGGRPEVKGKFLLRLSVIADSLKGGGSSQVGNAPSSSQVGPRASSHQETPVREKRIVHL